MKELSMEQKAKAYDEALERVKKLLSRCRNNRDRITMVYRVNDIESIFPELKESEDERIRKALIKGFNECLDSSSYPKNAQKYWHGIAIEDIFTWLENQAEQKPADFYCQENCKGFQETGKCFADGDCKAKREAESNNKNEPKFHEGDWVIYNNDICQIVKREEGCNILVTQFGVEKEPVNERNLSTAKLWDISDARDGDVLFHSDSASNGIFIFKEIIDKGFAKEIICYCDYDSEDHFCLGEHHTCCWTDVKILYPATKEQRDLLFQKMKEAGYDWDTEKKELKKIEESENIKNQIMSEITDLVKDYITQKTAKWSEEDELSCFESALFTAFSDAWQQYLRGKEVDIAQWAKEHSKELLEAAKEELKGHNSAWSEEDTEISSMLIELIESKEKSIEAKVEFVAWLKSLKDRIIALANRCSSGNK